eukprot:UN12353
MSTDMNLLDLREKGSKCEAFAQIFDR